MRSIVVLSIITFSAAWLVVHSLPDGEAQAAVIHPTQEVASIAIDCDERIDTGGVPQAQLRMLLGTRVGGTVDSAQLERDRVVLQDWLVERGYLGARVAAPVVTFGKDGGAYVVFDIARGPLYHLRSVELAGAGWQHAGVVTIARGDEAVGVRLERARQLAEATLAHHGDKLHVDLVAERDNDDAMVDVKLVTY